MAPWDPSPSPDRVSGPESTRLVSLYGVLVLTSRQKRLVSSDHQSCCDARALKIPPYARTPTQVWTKKARSCIVRDLRRRALSFVGLALVDTGPGAATQAEPPFVCSNAQAVQLALALATGRARLESPVKVSKAVAVQLYALMCDSKLQAPSFKKYTINHVYKALE